MSIEKEDFLRTRLVSHFQQLNPSEPPRWGKMSVQHMIEHFAFDALQNANGKLIFEKILTPPENLDRMRSFMMSDKPFKENTMNTLMGEELIPLKFKTVQAAIGTLQEELIYFFEVYQNDPEMIIRNPFWGDLNFEQNVQLLHKHALHHLRQFGIEPIG